jgi:hypothetical protein
MPLQNTEVSQKLLERSSRSFSLLFEIDVVALRIRLGGPEAEVTGHKDEERRYASSIRQERLTSNEANASCVALKREDAAAESVCCRAVPKSAHSSPKLAARRRDTVTFLPFSCNGLWLTVAAS